MDTGPLDVLVIGEALVDIVDRDGHRTVHPGGSPANVALGLGRLGVDVALLTDLGRDEYGTLVSSHLEESGVRVDACSYSDRPTSRALARIEPDGSASYEFDVSWAPSLQGAPARASVTHTGSIGVFLSPGGAGVRELLAKSTSPEITLDPNIRPALLGSVEESRAIFEATAAFATAVKLSDEDAGWLYPALSPEDVLGHIARLGPRLVALTMGGAGSMLAAEDTLTTVSVPPTVVVDTIGAGDTYMASLIDSLLHRAQAPLTTEALQAIGRRAARAAAITVSRSGANLPTREELDRG